jgi:PAS domain S-box-containing protein
VTKSPLTSRWGRACLGTLLLTLAALCASAASPKRVLLLYSFGRDFAPYQTFSGHLRTELASQMAEPIAFFEASLESARFGDSQQEDPLLDYLRAEFALHHLDLVVPIGGPAARFVQQHRQQLFPETPMLIAADQRVFDRTKLSSKDTTSLIVNEPALTVGMILQVLPQTTNVVVVIGDSALERFWSTEIQRELQPFTNRVSFVWLNQMPFPEMLKRCAALPPRSAIYFPLLCVDAAGVPQLEEHAMVKLHEVANAPVFGIWSTQLGRGILGGRLMDGEEHGRNTASAAVRILHGESPGSIQIPPQKVGLPEFDWRELRRWGISEGQLPAGSVVRFRQPGFWERYEWLVCGGILLAAVEAALIVRLLIHRAKRRQGEAVATLITELSSRFINLPADKVDSEIDAAQRRVCESMGLNLSALWQWAEGPPRYFKMTHLYRPLGGPAVSERFDGEEVFPWCLKKLLAGEVIPVSSMDALPPEAGRDRESWLHFGIKSNLTFPLLIEGRQLIGGLSFNTVRKARAWPEELVTRLELVAQIFANALARKRADMELRESEARLSLAADAAGAGLWRLDPATPCFWVTAKTRELFAFGTDEVVTFDRFFGLVHPEDRESVRQKVQQVLESRQEVQVEYRVLLPNGSVRWVR